MGKTNKRFLRTVFPLAVSFLFSVSAWAFPELGVCVHPAYQDYAEADGDYAVWQDNRNGTWDIYGYQFSTQSEFAICKEAGNQQEADISGSIVVWEDNRNGNWDIYGYNLTTKTEFPICTKGGDQRFPDISGMIVVWQDSRNGNLDIYGYDLGVGGGERIFCVNMADQRYPVVCGDKVAWEDYRNGNWDIYGGNMMTIMEFPICTNGSNQYYPSVSNDYVVWVDGRNGNWDIYGAMISAGPPFTDWGICTHAASQPRARVCGNVAAWNDSRNGSMNVYGYDLTRRNEFPIVTSPGSHFVSGMSGNRVLFSDNRNGNWDIYQAILGLEASAVCAAIDFEYVADGSVITDQYEGVMFSAPDSYGGGCAGDAVIRNMSNYGGTSSGVNALGTQPGPGCEFSPEFLRMVFDVPQDMVSFTVGASCGTYQIRAYDAAVGGALVSSQSVVISGCTTWHGVHYFVEVTSATKNIKRIDIDGGSGVSETIDDLLFNVDTTPPSAEITSPGFHACTCDEVEVFGEACEPDGVFGMYLLEYQPSGGGAWQPILSSTEPVCGGGSLGVWDTTGLSHGYYYLRLTVSNACGLTATAVTVAYVDKVFNSLEIRYPQPGQVVRGSSVCLDGTVWDNICFAEYDVLYRPAGSGGWMQVQPTATSSVINDPFAQWNTTVIPDGEYELRVEGFDVCGNNAQEIRQVRVDNTAPVAVLTEPAACISVGGLVEVVGTAADANLQSWTLQYTGDHVGSWVTIATGNVPVVNDVLAVWNTSGLPECAYTLRLRVWDTARLNCSGIVNESEFTRSVNVGPVTGNPDLNGDGCINLLDYALMAAQWLEGCGL